MPLPTKRTPPVQTLDKLTMLIYGHSKIGKSTWCSHAPGALFLATEPGLGALDVYQYPIGEWNCLLTACSEIAAGEHDFRTIVLDTVDNAYRMCADHVCLENGVVHQSDLDYGKGWSLVNNEFHRVLLKLAHLPYGLYLVSHSVEKEIDTKIGKKIHTRATLPDKAREIVLQLVDMILYCDIQPEKNGDQEVIYKRVMRTRPSPLFEAGHRGEILPAEIPLDYDEFVKLYKVGLEDRTKAMTNKEETKGKLATITKKGSAK